MGKGFLTYSTAVILQAVGNGYLYGFDIIAITGMPGGTVYPALRRLEEAGFLVSTWEKERVAHADNRPRRCGLRRVSRRTLFRRRRTRGVLEKLDPGPAAA